jgi:hypothetical protein
VERKKVKTMTVCEGRQSFTQCNSHKRPLSDTKQARREKAMELKLGDPEQSESSSHSEIATPKNDGP